MHFHLPKPLHGWREFAGEVGIIVIGVLIALGAEQVVEELHHRNEVGELRRALRAELADDRARWEGIRAGDFCAERRLDALTRWLATARPGARLFDAYIPFLWNLHSSAWNSAGNSPAGQLLPLNERLTYASLYDAFGYWRQTNYDEVENSRNLNALFATADQPENRRQLPALIIRARGFLEGRRRNYPYFFERFDALRIRPDASKLTLSNNPRQLCGPLENR